MNAPVELRQVACSNLNIGETQLADQFRKIKLDPARKEKKVSLEGDSLAYIKRGAADVTKKVRSSPVDVDAYCCSLSSNTTSASSSSSSTYSTKVPKRVTFAFDAELQVLCEVYKNYEPRTRKEHHSSWYTQAQFMQFRKECRKEVIMMSKSSYRKNFSAVYEACNKGTFKAVTKERAYISAASCRGLEVVVFPTLHRDRKNTIQQILRTQAALPCDIPLEKRQDALASASRFLSKKSRQLARILGSGDAAVVVANDRIAAANKNCSKPANVPQLFTVGKK